MAIQSVQTPPASSDVVAVFAPPAAAPVFPNAQAVKAKVTENSKLMQHPVEDGATITDFRIIEPVVVELSVVVDAVDYRSVYQQIKKIFLAATLLSVQTKADTYTNMLLEAMPHEEDPAMFDTIALNLKFQQVIIVAAQFGTLPPAKVKRPKDASTVNKGEQPAQEEKNQTLLYRIFH